MRLPRLLWLCATLALAACAAPPPADNPLEADRRGVAELNRAILTLGPGVDPEEAQRAARIAYSYTRQLAQEYGITDPPLVHNAKVHLGLRPRGLCYEWAEDIEARMLAENFRTLQMHRAIAPATITRIEHSTAIVSRRGDSLEDGLILDPWRTGGTLFWTPVRADTNYEWLPKDVVLDERREIQAERRRAGYLAR